VASDPEPEGSRGMIGKLTRGVQVASPVVGGFVGLLTAMEGIAGIQATIENMAAGIIHAPNPKQMFGTATTFGTGLGLIIGGVCVQMFSGLHPVIKPLSKIAMGLGGGILAGGAIGRTIYSMTHSEGAGYGYGADHGMHHDLYFKGAGSLGATQPMIPPYGTTHIGVRTGSSAHPYA